jgi:putative flippase GtrA
MGSRARRISGEAAKFSAVNVAATVVAIVLFNLLVHGIPGLYTPGPLNGWPVTSWFLANCVGMVISYFGSRHYAFRNRRPAGPAGGALRYAAVNVASFVIPMACLWVSRNVLGWDSALADNLSANVVGALLGMVFRFWAFRRFVFRHPVHTRHVSPATLAWLETEEMEPGSATAAASGTPEVGPHVAQLVEHQPEQRQAQPDDVVRVAGHARDEGAAEPVDGEGTRDR